MEGFGSSGSARLQSLERVLIGRQRPLRVGNTLPWIPTRTDLLSHKSSSRTPAQGEVRCEIERWPCRSRRAPWMRSLGKKTVPWSPGCWRDGQSHRTEVADVAADTKGTGASHLGPQADLAAPPPPFTLSVQFVVVPIPTGSPSSEDNPARADWHGWNPSSACPTSTASLISGIRTCSCWSTGRGAGQ